ncbi:protease pro-enzyme activation domain-containing protein [Kitasatospora sp. DSM 101779]|uniref:S53 family peptidase n=1 Tax=Kitasatospora sp. DSM 101779 TaxID=2853165 RepID=UPI0021DA0E74|nr:S53 family peptidase [Kitasatospora sp. DSM 101779]MCU7827048.1 peptidase S53 [Kitasatospora sp. DSM 101779]
MATNRMVPLPGSKRAPAMDARRVGAVDESDPIDITLVLRRRAEIPDDLIEGSATISRQELAERYGADPADIDLVRRAVQEHGLHLIEADPATRRVKVRGTLSQLRNLADPESLDLVESRDPATGRMVEHRHREGELRIPADWQNVVVAVLGMDDRPQARPHIHRLKPAAAHRSYTPVELGKIYRFPPNTDGSGQTLAILELGGGFTQADLDTYFSGLGISPTPSVTAVGVDGGSNSPEGDPNGPDGEVLLDIEVAGALAPRARQVVYFAPNTDQGFADALSAAVHATPTPTAVSISWGLNEERWTMQGRAVFDDALADAAALGVTVCVAAGDNGSSDGESDGLPHTDYPAASPRTLACGGTRLDADPATGKITSERVWNNGPRSASGGGVSKFYKQPPWQADVGVPNGSHPSPLRGVPDVAADADPGTGYKVLIDGQSTVIGGTSAVAPLWAALACRLSEALGRPLGLLQPLLYDGATAGTSPAGFRDITQGDIGAFKAGPGWDACTGLGVPDGTELLARLQA